MFVNNNRLALESICLMCLDSRIGSFPDNVNNDQLLEAVRDGDVLIEATKMMFDSFNKLYYGLPFWKYFATTAYSNLDKSETTIYEITSKYIEKEMDAILNGKAKTAMFCFIVISIRFRYRGRSLWL